MNAETAKTIKHLSWMIFLLFHFAINFFKTFPLLLIFSHISQVNQQTHEISEGKKKIFCLKNPVIVFKINANSSALFKTWVLNTL